MTAAGKGEEGIFVNTSDPADEKAQQFEAAFQSLRGTVYAAATLMGIPPLALCMLLNLLSTSTAQKYAVDVKKSDDIDLESMVADNLEFYAKALRDGTQVITEEGETEETKI